MKNFKITITVVVLLTTATQLLAQPQQKMYKDHPETWKVIDSLDLQGLPQSALEVTKALYDTVKQENNWAQVIKTLIYLNKFMATSEEDWMQRSIARMETEIKVAPFPLRPILQSMVAEMYNRYLEDNYWKFSDRTNLTFNNADISTWTIDQIAQTASEYYWKSIENKEELSGIDISDFDAITTINGKDTLRPTLFDFLGHRALDHFMNERSYLTQPGTKFYIKDKAAFWDAETFVNQEFNTSDTSSFKYQALKLYQILLKARLGDNNLEALNDLDLARLKYMLEHALVEQKEDHYLAALNRLLEKHKNTSVAPDIYYAIATLYQTQGNRYQPSWKEEITPPNDAEKWGYKKAVEICNLVINRYSKDLLGAKKCMDLKESLLSRELQIESERVNLPETPILLRIQFRNIKEVHFKVVKLESSDLENIDYNWQYEETVNFLREKNTVKTWGEELPTVEDFALHSVELKMDGLPYGYYGVLVSDNPAFNAELGKVGYWFTQVSRIAFFKKDENEGGPTYLLVDRLNGAPLADVLAEYFYMDYPRDGSRRSIKVGQDFSDKNGKIKPERDKRDYLSVKFSKDEDKLLLNDQFSFYTPYDYQNQEKVRVQFFLDRKIYRPGQTVYFKALLYSLDRQNRFLALEREKVTVLLRDVNGQEMGKLDLVSNEFGTVNGQFKLPESGLTGLFSMETSSGLGYMDFFVEEYKRPKFEVKLDSLEKSYALNDTVKISGVAMAFAGYPIDGAKVVYTINRSYYFPWIWWGFYRGIWPRPAAPTLITRGEAITNDKGEFEFNFQALPDFDVDPDNKPLFTFDISVEVVDISGETRTANKSLSLADLGLTANVDLPDQIFNTEPLQLWINTRNLDQKFINRPFSLSIFSIPSPETILLERRWEKPDLHKYDRKTFKKHFPLFAYSLEDEAEYLPSGDKVADISGVSESGKSWPVSTSGWKSGKYRVVLTTTDEKGNKIESQQIFTFNDVSTGKLATGNMLLAKTNKRIFEPGESAELNIYTAESLNTYFEFGRTGDIRLEEWFNVEGSTPITYEIKESDRGGLYYSIFAVKHNRVFWSSGFLEVPWSDKKLNIEWLTFRDKLMPGQEEEWQIKISGPNKDVLAAEVLATMYDASLDAFASNDWSNFNPYSIASFNTSRWSPYYFESIGAFIFGKENRPRPYIPYPTYRNINWFGTLYSGYYPAGGLVMRSMTLESQEERAVVYDSASSLAKAAPAPPPPPPSEPYSVDKPEFLDQSSNNATNAPVEIRSNLNETVFFMPELRTDAEGNVVIAFKMNEALTKWKFMAFAHTHDLKLGYTTKEVVTQKELMVVPNPPRFLRAGDVVRFSTKINNLSDRNLQGSIALQLFDAQTMQPVDGLFGNTEPAQSFSVDKGLSTVAFWSLKIPELKTSALLYRVVATSGNYSDGEENTLPVLTNSLLVTETLPLSLKGKQKKTFELSGLTNSGSSGTLKHHQLTLEFSSNPAWYAVQALPYLMEFPYECTEQIFNRFYANSLAQTVVDRHPKIKNVFETWKNTDALMSNLQKNQSLKQVLLEETPWVMDAQNEAQQRKNIALLFDVNKMGAERREVLLKLKERQSENGGFAWFPGGRENWYITQYLVEGFGHLEYLKTDESGLEDIKSGIVNEAVYYIDAQMKQYYDRILEAIDRKEAKYEDDHLSPMIIHYLYARTFYLSEIQMEQEKESAFDFFSKQLEKFWLQKPLYQQALIGSTALRLGKKDFVAKILKSLKERAIRHEELGMYWKQNYGYFWYELPIETHTAVLELFADAGGNEAEVDAMKVWLLKNKQTNNWKTTKATASAVYALLNYGDDWLEPAKPMKFDFDQLATDKYEAKVNQAQASATNGTGYFQTSWKGEEVTPDFGKISIKNSNKTIAWGSLYWQYFEEMDKIKTFEDTPLKLKKQVYKSVFSETGPILNAITENTQLNPGDKLMVRIELRVDRDMEYVHMKDLRASGLEPENVFSQHKWQDGLGYYEATKDAATHFFFDYLPKGTYVFEYPLRVNLVGDFSNGVTTIQCMYAPEFTSHSQGTRIQVKP